ncbi:MAG TPA: type VI secretion system tip protein TssI/VgrG, partial [Candidatus Nanopelagicales bacterium]|nr:type VI secretion system tip protein TssI/VgrG [Candidatus Nanopelagicales bacterium]
EGTHDGEWVFRAVAHFADQHYRPPLVTEKPRIHGVQSALVVGPEGEEIYTDEFGRVRVQFHWDREGKYNDNSSIWMRVSQGWAGGGYGMFTIPRVGHEVLVTFLDGDVDNPIVVGRVFNGASQVPHKLPANKTVSTWRSCSSPGGDGFNEIRFEDAAGREMIFEHSQKDKNQLVRNDERCGVGRHRTRTVKQNETIAVGGSRTKAVALDQTEAIGLTQTTAIGLNRNTTVGVDDATLIGSKYSVTMARGVTSKLSRRLGELMGGAFGPLLKGPVEAVLGVLPNLPLGALGAMTQGNPEGPLSVLHAVAPGALRGVIELLEDLRDEPGPPPTSIEMVDRKITFTTGEASIILEGPNITLMADGNIMLHARQNAGVLADGEVAIAAEKKALFLSKSDDAIVQGGPNVQLNPFDVAARPDAPAQRAPYHEVLEDEEERCEECGEPLAAAMPGSPLSHKSAREDGKVCSRVARRSERWDLPLAGWEKQLLDNIKRGTPPKS